MSNRRYFDVWDFERDGRFYEQLGIRWFKRLATDGDFWNKRRRKSDPSFRKVKDFDSALAWEARTRRNEVIHLCSLAVGLAIMDWLYSRGEYAWLVAMFFVVVIWEIYPIMLQRYNPARIWRTKAASENKRSRRGASSADY